MLKRVILICETWINKLLTYIIIYKLNSAFCLLVVLFWSFHIVFVVLFVLVLSFRWFRFV